MQHSNNNRFSRSFSIFLRLHWDFSNCTLYQTAAFSFRAQKHDCPVTIDGDRSCEFFSVCLVRRPKEKLFSRDWILIKHKIKNLSNKKQPKFVQNASFATLVVTIQILQGTAVQQCTGCFTIVETKRQLLKPLSMTLFIFLFPDCHREIVNLSIY